MNMNLSQVTKIWVNGRSPNTVVAYETLIGIVEKQTQDLFQKGIIDVSEIELTEVVRAHTVKCSPSTKNVRIWIIKGFFTTVQRLGLRSDNPASGLRPPKFEDKLADKLLTHEEVQKILAKARLPRDKVLIQLLYGAGLRISEALGMKKKDLLGGGTIRVWGKGGKTAYVRIQPTLDTLLATWTDTLTPEDYLFQGYHGKRLLRGSAQVGIQRIARRAGFPRVTPHFFRHAHASVALQNGASIVVVQRSLRHASIDTTMRYLHHLPGDGAANYLPAMDSPQTT